MAKARQRKMGGVDGKDSVLTWILMLALSFQVGLQPIVVKLCIHGAIDESTLVISCEFIKFFLGILVLLAEGSLGTEYNKWSFHESLMSAALPACIYSMQNMLIWIAYQNTTGLTFNMVNQTKTAFAALFIFIVLKKRQTAIQVFALMLLMFSALVLSLPETFFDFDFDFKHNSISTMTATKENDFFYGILPAVSASALSGLAASLCQFTLQGQKRHATIFSMELAVYSALTVFLTAYLKGKSLSFSGWDMLTVFPVLTQALGGLLIGQLTKLAGGIRKGFAVCAGVIITAVTEDIAGLGTNLGVRHGIGLALLLLSLFMYHEHPQQPAKTKQKTT